MKNIFYFSYYYIFFIKIIMTNDINNNINNIPEKCLELCSQKGGICTENLKCICKKGYSTDFSDENFYFCNYKQYNKKIAGTLELIFGFGFGHFYCHRYLNGFIQLIIEYILCCLMACITCILFKLDMEAYNGYISENTYTITCIYFPSIFLALVLWQIADSIYFFSCYYKDGNGISLY